MIKNKGISPAVVGVEVINDAILATGVPAAAAANFDAVQSVLKAAWPEMMAE